MNTDISPATLTRSSASKPRQVPILTPWARTLEVSIGERANGPGFHGYRLHEYPPRILQTFIADHPFPVRPSATRLHNTWFVTHRDSGTPLRLLLEISGLTSTQGLLPHLPFTRPVEVADYLTRTTGNEKA
jgi:hypothetical protein